MKASIQFIKNKYYICFNINLYCTFEFFIFTHLNKKNLMNLDESNISFDKIKTNNFSFLLF